MLLVSILFELNLLSSVVPKNWLKKVAAVPLALPPGELAPP